MKAFIFAAGLGTRMKPLTDTMPKALVPVGGRPLVKYLIDKLLKTECSGIVVNVHHFAEQIIEYVRGLDLPVGVEFSDETDMLRETGGAIRHAAQYLRGDEPFLVHNSDVVSNVDVDRMCGEMDDDCLAMLLVSERKTSRYLLFDGDRLVGWTNVQTGEVKSPYKDLKVEECRKLAFAGVHVISPRILALMDDWGEKFSIIDFYLSVADKELIKAYEQEALQMVDVGKYVELEEAAKAVKRIVEQ